MMNRVLSLLVAAGLAVAAVACESGPAAPTAPTSSPVGAGQTSATVEGTVGLGNGNSAMAEGVRALANLGGARVSVVGQTAATMSDASGRFILKDVSPGRAELRFEASGVDARLEIGNVTQGQTLSVAVQVDGPRATLAQSDDRALEVSLRGQIESIGGSDLHVSGRRVTIDGATKVLDRQNGATVLAAFRVGDLVQIEGAGRPDGSVLALTLKLEDRSDPAPAPAPGASVNFVGSIVSLSPLSVAGRTVLTDASTRVLDRQNSPTTLAALRVGGIVEVEGTSRPDGSVLASKIKLEDDDIGDNRTPSVEVNFVGIISSKSPFVVAGRTVLTDAGTRVLDRRNNPITLAALAIGGSVEVEGTLRADGSVLAKKIKQEDADEPSPGGEVNIVGSISGLSPLAVAGRTVVTDAATRLLDRQNNPITLGSFKLGDRVEVEGVTRQDGAIFAKKIKLQD